MMTTAIAVALGIVLAGALKWLVISLLEWAFHANWKLIFDRALGYGALVALLVGVFLASHAASRARALHSQQTVGATIPNDTTASCAKEPDPRTRFFCEGSHQR
jgi:glucose uptake protein GlcU